MKRDHSIDMLNGSLLGPSIRFALPLIATGFLQQSFNSADALVVGHYCPSSSLAAVGSNGPVINLIVTLFMGLGVGINVIIASYIGRRDEKGVRRAVATTGVLALVCGFLLMIVGYFMSSILLEALGTPEDVLDSASTYLEIFFMGMPFIMVYNFGAAILRSVGDTARPFYILIAGCLTNVGLDLYLVGVIGMGVAGAAIGTVVGIGVNATLVALLLIRDKRAIRLDIRSMKIHYRELKNIVRIGFPAGLQGVVFSISNVFILSAINSFGSAASAGSAAALNYELYCYYVVVGFVQATVAFTSQNYAAGKIDRCKNIYKLNMLLSAGICCVMNAIIVLNKEFFIGLFTSDEAVMPFAYDRLTIVLLFQFVACSYEVSGGAMRAMGYSMTPTIFTVFGTCVLRLMWVFLLPVIGGGFGTLMSIYPISWVVTGAIVIAAYTIVCRKAYRLVGAKQKIV